MLAGELEALARGDEERDARARLPESRDLDRDAGQEVLAVVDHEQALLAGERRSDRIHQRLVGLDTERPGERRRDEVRIAQRCERLPREPVGELLGGLGRRLEREAGLAAAAGAGEGDQPGPTREHPRDLRDLGAPADEGRGGDGEVRTMDRPQRREVPLSELVQADRLGEVLQPLLAEVVQGKRRGPEDTCGRGGEDYLPSVARLGDTRRTVHVQADVPPPVEERLARVQPGPDAERALGELFVDPLCRLGRVARGGERAEERVALRVDLDPSVPVEGCADDPLMRPQRVPVRRGPEALERPRRPLHVGEQERHRPLGEGGRDGGRSQGGILREDALLELPERSPRLDAERVDQLPSCLLVRRQRVGLPSGAVEGDHQLSRERLAVGMLCRQLLQLGDELAVASEHQVGLDPIPDRREPELVQTVGLAPRPLLVGEVGEGAAPPQRECLAETCARPLRSQLPERLSAFRGELLEARDVEVSGV